MAAVAVALVKLAPILTAETVEEVVADLVSTAQAAVLTAWGLVAVVTVEGLPAQDQAARELSWYATRL